MDLAEFAGYRLEELVGRGGMGEVWRARTPDGRTVAVKILASTLSGDPEYRQRFEREARLGMRLRDPHLVPIHDFGEHDGSLFLVMDFVEGTDLAQRLRGGPLEPAAAVAVLTQLAAALDVVHAADLVHRDVKPANVLLDRAGSAYLIDFGIARAGDTTSLTATNMAVGTWAYMAPERFTGTVDARADIYALGCVLYECLTGSRPYGNGDPAQQMHGHLMSAPTPASAVNSAVPLAVDAALASALAKDPADRPPTAGAFATAVRQAFDGEPVVWHQVPPTTGRESSSRQSDVRQQVPSAAAGTGGTEVRQDFNGAQPGARQQVPLATGAGTVWPAGPAPTAQLPPTALDHSGGQRLSNGGPFPGGAGPAPTRAFAADSAGWPVEAPYAGGYPAAYATAPRADSRRGRLLVPLTAIAAVVVLIVIGIATLSRHARTTDTAGKPAGTTTRVVAGQPPTTGRAAPPPKPGSAIQAPGLHTPVRSGGLEFTVTAVESNVPTIGRAKAKGGFVVVTVNVTDVDDIAANFFTGLQQLIDSGGRVVDEDIKGENAYRTAHSATDRMFGIDPGQTVTAHLVFDLPAGAAPGYLQLRDGPVHPAVMVALN
ncbi:serine/threonine-protein kinase [Nocardia stercoris]|nr:serine/threonine-protein kinase [Nocardia stercoris]